MNRARRALQRRLLMYRKKLWQRRNSRQGSQQVVLVGGVQRSGTTMLMTFLERLFETEVYYERDPRVFDGYLLREPKAVLESFSTTSAHHPVVRVQFDFEKMGSYIDSFMPSKSVYIFRRYENVVSSYLRTWPGGRNKVDSVATNREWDGWQGQGIRDAVYEELRSLYRPDLNDASVIALFWWYRNEMYFDLSLHEDPRVLPISYEAFVPDPSGSGRELTEFIGARFRAAAANAIYSSSLRKPVGLDIDPKIVERCERMYARLEESWKNRHDKSAS